MTAQILIKIIQNVFIILQILFVIMQKKKIFDLNSYWCNDQLIIVSLNMNIYIKHYFGIIHVKSNSITSNLLLLFITSEKSKVYNTLFALSIINKFYQYIYINFLISFINALFKFIVL